MAIERLSLIDTITSSTYFAVNVNNQDYRAAANTVAEYIQSQGTAGDGKIIQYAGPTATGFSVTVNNSGDITTFGINAAAFVAQSIGGGGGAAPSSWPGQSGSAGSNGGAGNTGSAGTGHGTRGRVQPHPG